MTPDAIQARFTVLDNKVLEVVKWLRRMDERHAHSMYGNGKPGLQTEVERLKTNELHRERREQLRDKKEWAMIMGIMMLLVERALGFL